jgi:fatty-acyl-CoA synthase
LRAADTQRNEPARASYAHGAVATPLRGETIGAALAGAVASHGEREAVVSCRQGVRLTYAELGAAVEQCALALLAAGVKVGDRVGIWAPNCVEWIVVQYATARVGAILVTVNPAYRQSELDFVLNQAGVSVLVYAHGYRGVEYGPMVEAANASALRLTVEIGEQWDAFLERAAETSSAALEERETHLTFDQPINIQYTSGTTGAPKGATLSHHNILSNGYMVGQMCGYDEHERICIPVPFYHCFGMVMGNLAAVTHGACAVIPSESFEARAVLEAVSAERCTSLYGVPTMFIAILADEERESFDVSSLRTGIMAGSPCPVEVMKRVVSELHMPEVTICYGMTETSPVSAQTSRDDPLDKRVGTVGRVHPHLELKIVAPATALVVPRGTPGELCTRGYSVMLGYWDDDTATLAAIDRSRYMHTGDLATMDDEGYVEIVGRIKDLVIRGGENISPREVEEFLYTHPSIRDVQVFGVPDEHYGEELCAWVIVEPGAQIDAATVRSFCDGNIARFKIPRYVRVVEVFPLTVTGKVQKFRMREQEIETLGLGGAETSGPRDG